jgi:ribose 5-phosphate isomerase A
VLDFAPGVVADRLRALGATTITTRPERSDNGNLLVDAHFVAIDDPDALATALERTPGIVDHGIFRSALVERVIVAGTGGTRELVNDERV